MRVLSPLVDPFQAKRMAFVRFAISHIHTESDKKKENPCWHYDCFNFQYKGVHSFDEEKTAASKKEVLFLLNANICLIWKYR